jgi:hypothetical protein
MGMREELVRTDEEKQRYRQLVELNRQRRQEMIKAKEKPSKFGSRVTTLSKIVRFIESMSF